MSRTDRFLMWLCTIAVALSVGLGLSGQVTIPYTFTAGTVIDPDQMNTNFSTLGTQALNRTGGTMTGDLLFTDALYDIGKIGATRPRDISLSRDLTAGDQLFERGRTTALGEWTTPAFAGGNFTANGAMTWTVDVGDVTTQAYTLIGKTMTITLDLRTTTVGGVVNTDLQVALPGGFTAAKSMNTPCVLIDNGVRATGFLTVDAAGTVVRIRRLDLGNFTASANNTAVQGEIVIEVQ